LGKEFKGEEITMSLLRRLRGEPRFSISCFGGTLTLYRQGSKIAMLVGLATVALYSLPWNLISADGAQVAQPMVLAAGSYFAATLIASRAPLDTDLQEAASRWL
jgi:hypothetical protein